MDSIPRNRRHLALLPLAGLLALAGPTALLAQRPAPAVAGEPTPYAGAIGRASAFIRDTMAALGAPGASITVIQGGRVIWSAGFGYADLEEEVPVTPLTRFRVGSVSKSLTSIAIGRLVEEGKLDLDAEVQRYVPTFPKKRWPVTVREVAGHLSGIRHYRREEENISYRHYTDVVKSLEVFADDTLDFEPGTKWAYSSYGWNLLSAVVQAAAGEDYLTYMDRAVFHPAGMRHTGADQVDSIVPHRARWYTRTSPTGGIVNAPFTDNSYKWAGGGFLSTTEDLAGLADDLLHGRLLRPETVRLLWTPQHLTSGKATNYGIGWFVDTDQAGRRRVFHSGGSVGGTAFVVIYPDQDLILSLLVNSDFTFVDAGPTIAEMFLAAVPGRR